MISLLVLLALQTAPAPFTVGDTIWLARVVRAGAGATVRPAPWDPEGPVTRLGEPVVRTLGDSTVVAYPAAAWQAGTHELVIPGPILIRPDGTVDSLPPQAVSLTVASVLPAGADPRSLPVQPEAGLVVERYTTPVPLLLLSGAAALLSALLAWWWRRRGPPLGEPRAGSGSRAAAPLDAWSAAGEGRAVAAVAGRDLREAMRRHLPAATPGHVVARLLRLARDHRPEWPAEELAAVLEGLEAAAFAERADPDAATLAGRAQGLAGRMQPPGRGSGGKG